MLKLEINGVDVNADQKLKNYINKKIGRLDRFMSRHVRESAHGEVFLKERKVKGKKENICEVVLKLPGETVTSKEATINMYAAVDIVEAKLKNQLKKYKLTHGAPQLRHRLISKLRRQKHRA